MSYGNSIILSIFHYISGRAQEIYSGYLKEENCEVNFNNEEGDFIEFTYEGVNYLLSVDEDPVTDIAERVGIVKWNFMNNFYTFIQFNYIKNAPLPGRNKLGFL